MIKFLFLEKYPKQVLELAGVSQPVRVENLLTTKCSFSLGEYL